MAFDFYLSIADDTRPELQETITQPDGTPVNLTGYTITAKFVHQATGTVVNKSGTIVTAASGICKFTFAANDLLLAGGWDYQLKLAATGVTVRVPNDGGYKTLWASKAVENASAARLYYPTRADLQAFLEGHGLDLAAALVAQLAPAIDGARGDFEGDVRRVMLAPEDDATRRFDPPRTWRDNGARLFLPKDLAALTTVVYQPTGQTAETLTENEDYVLEPYDAPDDGYPYTCILFFRRWTQPIGPRMRRSLLVTGRWGFGTTIPGDAWLSICARGASRLFTHISHSETGGLLSWKDDDASEDFGVETWTRLKDSWAQQYLGAVTKYWRWDAA